MLLIFLALMLGIISTSFADVITIGSGTSYTYEPIASYYGYHRSACIYTAGEIGGSGTITTISYKAYNTNSTSIPIKIYMKMTTAATLSPAQNWGTLTTGLTPIYNATFSGTTAGAWKTITLTTPFSYTGNNLMILIESNYGGNGTSGPQWYHSPATNMNQYIRKDSTAPITETGTVNSNRPQIQMNIVGYAVFAPTFAVSPTTVDFGLVNMNTTSAYTNVTVSNNGAGTLNITGVSLGGANPERFILDMNSNPTPWALTAGQSKIVKVAFNPLAAVSSSASLIFTGDVKVDHTVPLSGTGYDPTLVPPTTQDFTTFPPLNWTRWSGLLADPSTLTTTTSGWIADGFANVGSTGAARVNVYGTSCKYWLVTPPINLGSSKITGYNLSFDLALTAYGLTTPPTGTQADDKFAVVISTDNGVTWSAANTLRLWDNAGSPYVYNEISVSGQTITIPLSGYSGMVKIGFYGESTVSDGDNDLFIDNFAIVEAGAPPTPPTSSIPANGATSVAINTNLSWGGATGEPTGYKVYLGTDSETQDLIANVPDPIYDPETNFDFGATYYWKVDAYSDAGSSSDAGPLTVWTFSTYSGLAITPSPSNSATAQDATNKLLNWADVAGATGYRVKVGTSSGASDLVNMAEVAESQYTHNANWPFSQQIFWTVYTLNGEQVVDGTEWNFTTAADPTRPLPYLENFNASTSLPANWTATFSVSATHGASASNGLYKNLWSSATTANVVTPPVGPITANTLLEFDYRYVNYTGYPATATTLGAGDKLEVQVSTDGTTFDTVYTIDSSNHVTSTAFATCGVFITQAKTAAEGDIIKVKLLATWATGDYYLDIDNVSFRHVAAQPVISVTPTEKDFGTVNLNTTSAAQVFTIKNVGGGTLTIDPAVALSGDDADQFELTDANSYPCALDANESITVSVIFAPTTEGLKSAKLKIVDDLAKNLTEVLLSGTGFDATIDTFPYSEGFDAVAFPPVGWTNYSVDKTTHAHVETGYWSRKTTGTYNSTAGAAFINYSYSSARYACLQMPAVNIPSSHRLSFYWRDNDSKVAAHDTTYCEISTDGGTNWALLATLSPEATQSTYQKVDVGLNPYAGNGRLIRFRDATDASYSAWGTYLDEIAIQEGYDYPAGEPVVIGGETITVTGGSANNGTGEIPPVNNASFVTESSYVLQLIGAGPWTITIETTAPWGAYFQGGQWNSVQNIGGFITFIINGGKDAEIPVVLGDSDPTLPVELSSFTATITTDLCVKIAWIAQTETNHSGYNILRAEANDLTNAIKINPVLIDNGTPLGTQISYSYTDVEAYSNMVYYYWLESIALDGVSEYFGPLSVTIGDPSQPPLPPAIPMFTKLMNAFPNPFNPNTNLRYSLKEAGKVNISIYNVKGQLIKSFQNDHATPGYYQVSWDGRDMNGQPVSSGIYMYRMTSGKYNEAKKMILAK